MAHNESISHDPVKDRDIIEYVNDPNRSESKSGLYKRGVRLLMKYESILDPETLLERLESLAALADDMTNLVNRVERLSQQVEELKRSGIQTQQESNSKHRQNLDIMGQMDNL